MFSYFYQKNIIEKPKIVLIFLLLFLIGFGFFTKDFKLDASSDTLLLENDPDLEYLREINERYGSKDFLILTFTPEEPIIIGKQRHGPTGNIMLEFEAMFTKFKDLQNS